MKPLITYYGGSVRNASKIVEMLERIPHTVYAEPFCGGAAVLFAKRQRFGSSEYYREAINDSNQLIHNLYKVAIEQPEELNRRLQLTPYSQQVHRECRAICNNPEGYSAVEVAVATVVQCRQSFANGMYKGWGFGLVSQNRAVTWASLQDDLVSTLSRLKGVYIGAEDAIDFIDRWDSPQTLFYCDPPFVGTDQGHYKGYTTEQYQALIDCLDSCNSSYVLENYPQEIEPSSAQEKIEIDVKATCKKPKGGRLEANTRDADRTLCWYVCDRSAGSRPDLQGKLRNNQLQLF